MVWLVMWGVAIANLYLQVVAFLMSEEASFMNGSVVEVDGMPLK